MVERIIANEGEIDQELESQIVELDLSMKSKVDAYYFRLDELKSRAERFKEKSRQLARLSKSCETSVEWMKKHLIEAMHHMNKKELQGNEYRFRLSPTKPSVRFDSTKLSKEYYRVKKVREVDKEKLYELIKAGNSVEGAWLEQNVSIRSSQV